MKLGPVTKLDREKQNYVKKFDDNLMSESCGIIAMFPITSQFVAIWKPETEHKACKTYISTNSNLLSYKN